MNKAIEEALAYLIEIIEDTQAQEEIAKIEGYIYGLLEVIKNKNL